MVAVVLEANMFMQTCLCKHFGGLVLEMPELIMTNMFMHCFARNTTGQNIYTGGVGGKDNARTHS